MLQRMLINKHIKSDVASHGIEAIQAYLANPTKYSLIFMDNLMPEMVIFSSFIFLSII